MFVGAYPGVFEQYSALTMAIVTIAAITDILT
jgi:hypothetical protein